MTIKLAEITLRGLTTFDGPDPVRIPLEELGDGLVALVGRNGSGKTTLLEAVPAALWGMLPSKAKGKSLFDYANARDAFVELRFGPTRIRRTIDATARKTEAFAWEGEEPLVDGKISTFQLWAESLFGSSRLFLASVFAAQNRRGSILELPRADRRELFFELLELGRYEALRASCAGKAEALQIRAVEVRNERARIVESLTQRPALEESRDGWATKRALAEERERQADRELDQARGAVRAREAAAASLEGLKRTFREATTAHSEAGRRHDRRLAEAQTTEERLGEDLDRAQAELQVAEGRPGRIDAEQDVKRKEIEVDAASCRATVQDAAVIRAAVLEVPKLEKRVGEGLDALRKAAELALESQALGSFRGGLEAREHAAEKRLDLRVRVPCTKAEAWYADADAETLSGDLVELAATCPLLEDARNAGEELEAVRAEIVEHDAKTAAQGELLEEAALEAADVRAGTDQLRGGLNNARAQADRLGVLEAAEAYLERLDRNAEALEAEHARRKTEAVQAFVGAAARIVRLEDALVEHKTESDVGLDESLADRKKASAGVALAHDALREAEAKLETGEAPDVGPLEQALQEAKRDGLEASEKIGAVAGRLGELDDLEARLDLLPTDLDDELADWRLLERAFGPNGIPNLLVDAAGPEVAELTNRLLAECWGGRFQIEFRTLKELKKKRGEYREDFSIKVLDGPAERDVEDLSGGERAVLGEALGLACAIFNGRKSGIDWKTLFRDETAGALDPESARAYVSMLRRALEVGRFDQIVFIAHNPEVYEAADAQVFVADGAVSWAA